MKKNKLILFVVTILLILGNVNIVKADNACTKETALQMSKIIWHENGANSAVNKDENFFQKITTASIILNNASGKSGANWYQKIYNLTDNNYAGYSSYKNTSFEQVVHKDYQGQMLYIAELVLSGKYNVPKNMTLQAAQSIVERWGTVWCYVDNVNGFYDTYFGYEGSSLNKVDVFGNTISNTSSNYYKSIASALELSDYSAYTPDTVCTGLSDSIDIGNENPNQDNNGNPNDNEDQNENPSDSNDTNNENNNDDENDSTTNIVLDACNNPNILRVIYFIKIIIDIVKIIIPIGLIVMGTIDFSKAVMTSDESSQKKAANLFIKRVISGVIVFAIPWIVEVIMGILGNLIEDVNYIDCFTNANKETIEELERKQNN